MASQIQIDRYVRSVFPDRHRVLNVDLLPLSIGHVMLLHRLRNPVAFHGQAVALDDVAVAQTVVVCARPWRDAAVAVNTRWIWWPMTWLSFRARRDPLARFQLVRYLADACQTPRWWISADQRGRPCGAWYWSAVQISLCREFGMTPDEALDIPASQALAMCAVVWEQDQRIQMVSEEEEDLLRSCPPVWRPKAQPTSGDRN